MTTPQARRGQWQHDQAEWRKMLPPPAPVTRAGRQLARKVRARARRRGGKT